MLKRFLGLLALAAVALMPLGMSVASASAAHPAPIGEAARHCDEEPGQPASDLGDRLAGCTAACAMFIAEPARATVPDSLPRELTIASAAPYWMNLPPETATPPPKQN